MAQSLVKLVMALENAGSATELAESGTWTTIGVQLAKARAHAIHAKVKAGIPAKNAEVQGFWYIGCTIS